MSAPMNNYLQQLPDAEVQWWNENVKISAEGYFPFVNGDCILDSGSEVLLDQTRTFAWH
ncbi:hypothetical protein [Coleofasciculus sp. FACHB-1120]|uniref:hypothetical protein n=1 Tax=Coleofasciculus sp. FACHB-1120 TaxID=2692783 RepID=UPI00168A39FD|nr:hypothetical protein [Coleofasciculus sp. FACHB-1120]MBD2744721.1 hypothetical protein [Coleofasciculus sp. FACHB-1120]